MPSEWAAIRRINQLNDIIYGSACGITYTITNKLDDDRKPPDHSQLMKFVRLMIEDKCKKIKENYDLEKLELSVEFQTCKPQTNYTITIEGEHKGLQKLLDKMIEKQIIVDQTAINFIQSKNTAIQKARRIAFNAIEETYKNSFTLRVMFHLITEDSSLKVYFDNIEILHPQASTAWGSWSPVKNCQTALQNKLKGMQKEVLTLKPTP